MPRPNWRPRKENSTDCTQILNLRRMCASACCDAAPVPASHSKFCFVLQYKRLSEQERYSLLKESINILERDFKAEISRRNEVERHLQAHVDRELSQVSEQISGQIKDLQQTVRSGLDQMQRAVSNLNNLVMDEREQRKVDIDHVGTSLCARLDEVIQTVDEERFSRLEQERQSLKRYVRL